MTATASEKISGITVTVTEPANSLKGYRVAVEAHGQTLTGVWAWGRAEIDGADWGRNTQQLIDILAEECIDQLRNQPIDENTFAPTT